MSTTTAKTYAMGWTVTGAFRHAVLRDADDTLPREGRRALCGAAVATGLRVLDQATAQRSTTCIRCAAAIK